MRSWWSRGTGAFVLTAVVAVASLTGCVPPKNYVSLGDSFTAGPLIPNQPGDPPTEPAGCLRSTNNYPSLVAPSLTVRTHRDPSCSGARTVHMAAPQNVEGGTNPPQFDSLDANTSVVTLGIGGNDIGFVEIAKKCGELAPRDLYGAPCKAFYGNEIAERIEATGHDVNTVLEEIRSRSPRAKVFVVGYPAILPEQVTAANWPTCYAVLPVALQDMNWLRDHVEKALNTMLRTQAEANGAVYADTYPRSIGHDACALPTTERWVEPVVPAQLAAPVHPNINGMHGSKESVRETMVANGVPMK